MAVKVTIGGDRVGSGKKMTATMDGFRRSTFNVSKGYSGSMTPGLLYPVYLNIGTRDTTFEGHIKHLIRSVPTQAPLYGSFKLQIDMFEIPNRLYNKILHNNQKGWGMKTDKILFPLIQTQGVPIKGEHRFLNQAQIDRSSILPGLRIRGVGRPATSGQTFVKRTFCGVPFLGYYDIGANYYADQQRKIGYVCASKAGSGLAPTIEEALAVITGATVIDILTPTAPGTGFKATRIELHGANLDPELIEISYGNSTTGTIWRSLGDLFKQGIVNISTSQESDHMIVLQVGNTNIPIAGPATIGPMIRATPGATEEARRLELIPFDLKNIDDMRSRVFAQDEATPLIIGPTVSNTGTNSKPEVMPYGAALNAVEGNKMGATYPLSGLLCKCYQSDIYQNYLDSEWVAGAGGINELSAAVVENGRLLMNEFDLKHKMYDILNRIVAAGNTLDAWSEATYGIKAGKNREIPIYIGGMSAEVVFNEVVSTAATETSPLGQLAGKGESMGLKGGHFDYRITERDGSWIMAIASLTPRVTYSQGNWFGNRLETMADLHQPGLDGIAYQDLITDQMLASDTRIDIDGTPIYNAVGKTPAFMDWMTDVDEANGTFAHGGETDVMVLDRAYEEDETGALTDATTYVDPTKFNYIFADRRLEAQNFWIFLDFKMSARRIQSAKLIPGL